MAVKKEEIKFADDPRRDKNKIMICDYCKTKFHPRKDASAPRFCSQECTRKGSWGSYGSLGMNKK